LTCSPFLEETEELLKICKGLSQSKLQSLMSLSENLAQLNYGRFLRFNSMKEYAACWAFDGPAHRALNIRSFDSSALVYAHDTIVTLSGLYGCLRPTDSIRPHRLEMGTRLESSYGKSLVEFWGDKVAR
jgi:cytoplasmic iron level regulating protein YaaA (DUF328/UPF0246 family)